MQSGIPVVVSVGLTIGSMWGVLTFDRYSTVVTICVPIGGIVMAGVGVMVGFRELSEIHWGREAGSLETILSKLFGGNEGH